MDKLLGLFDSRRLFIDLLLEQNDIKMNLSRLIIVLERLQPLQAQSILDIMHQDPQ
jgi:hypothetical protein